MGQWDLDSLLITEIFQSIQGEGRYIGIPMLFVRTNRCNLRCRWCDSTYTFQGGTEVSLQELADKIRDYRHEWVCFTGGEPLLQKEAIKFVDLAHELGKNVLLETGGSLSVKEMARRDSVFIDMDIKTPSSGEERSLLADNLNYLRAQDYIKFVISDRKDFDYSVKFLQERKPTVEALFQPAWGTSLQWITEEVLDRGINARVLPQLHKIIWGERRGV